MKKLQLQDQPRLQLKKKQITALTQQEAEAIAGGITYSLSWGERCKESKGLGADNPYECGAFMSARDSCVSCEQQEM